MSKPAPAATLSIALLLLGAAAHASWERGRTAGLYEQLQNAPAVKAEELYTDEVYKLLLQRTGIESQLPLLKAFVAESANDNAARCGVLARDSDEVWLELFTPDVLRAKLIAELRAELDEDVAVEALAWFNSPLAEKISTLEQQAPQTPSNRTRHIWQLLAQEAPQKDLRASQIAAIIENTRATQYASTLGAEIEYAGAVYSGCIEKKAASKSGLNVEQIRANGIRADKSFLQHVMRIDAERETALRLQSLTEQEMASYSEFTASHAGQAFFYALTSAFDQTLASTTDTLRRELLRQNPASGQ